MVETSRLLIRKPTKNDVSTLIAIRNSEFVLAYNAMRTIAEEDFMHELLSEQNAYVLVRKDNQTNIGMIYIEEDSVRSKISSKELSYYLAESETRKGYMKEALEGMIDYLFSQQQLTCIGIRVFADNLASIALVRRLGFQQNGIIPSCVKGYKDIIHDDILFSKFRKV